MKPIYLIATRGVALGLLITLPTFAQDVNAMAGRPAPIERAAATEEAVGAETISETAVEAVELSSTEIRRMLEEAHEAKCQEDVKAAKSALEIHEAVRDCREKGRELYESFRTGTYMELVPVVTPQEEVEAPAVAEEAAASAELPAEEPVAPEAEQGEMLDETTAAE